MLAFACAASGALVLHVTAPERLACRRDTPDARTVCRLDREIHGVVVRTRETGPVQGAMVQTLLPQADEHGDSADVAWRLVVFTDAGPFSSVQGADERSVERVRARLQALLDGGAAGTVDEVLEGTPRAVPWALGAFAFGVALPILWALGWMFPSLRPNAARGA